MNVPDWAVMLILAIAALIPGYLIISLFRPRLAATWPETLFAALAFGIILVGWMAFLLAELGYFSITLLAVLWLLLTSTLLILTQTRHHTLLYHPQVAASHRLERLLLLLWLPLAAWLFFRPHEFIIGGADAGVYVNLGAEIARNGGILIYDETLAELHPTLYSALLRADPSEPTTPPYILPAFWVTAGAVGEITPQFYHLHPTWQAIAYGLGGAGAALMLTGLWALLGSLAVYFTVRHFGGWQIGMLALAGLSINALQVWFARYPVTEMLTQYLLWTGLWALGAWLEARQPRPLWALLAGLALGELFLVRIDAYLIWGIVGLIGVWLYVTGRWHKIHWWFFVPFTLLTAHSLVHAVWQSRPYFLGLFDYGLRLLAANPALPVAALAVAVLVLLGIGRYRQHFAFVARARQPLLGVAVALLVLLAGYGWFIRPHIDPAVAAWNEWYGGRAIAIVDQENLLRLGWYLSPLGIWLGVAGCCLLLWQMNRKTAAVTGIGLLFSLLYLWRIQINTHQIYAMRRYVPVTLPFFIVAAAFFIGWLAQQKGRRLTAVALLLALLWLGGLGWLARGFVSQVDYRGITEQVQQINRQLQPHAILIFNDPAPVGQGDLWGTPLRFLHGQEVFVLRDPQALDRQHFDAMLQHWQSAGRPLYWVAVPGGYEWPLPTWKMTPVHSYTLQTVALEGSYEHRPQRLISFTWQGDIYALQKTETR